MNEMYEMNRSIDVALVGAGYMANEHARAFASLPGVRIVGVCGRNPERAKCLAEKYGAPIFTDLATMHRETGAVLLVVAVNELSMRTVCEAAFRHPWVCVLEKPVGLNLSEAKAITSAAKAAGTRVFVALNRRAYSSTRKAMDELQPDSSPRLVSVLDQQDMASVAAAGQPDAVVRNYMYANSIHLIDYFNHFCRGAVTQVHNALPWTPNAPGHVVATLRYDSGDFGVYQAVWDGPGPWSVTVTNRTLRVEMRPLEKLCIQRRGERQLTDAPVNLIDSEFKPGLLWQAQQAIKMITGSPHELASLAEATRAMSLVAEIYGLQTNERA